MRPIFPLALALLVASGPGCSGMQKSPKSPKHDPPIPVVTENPTLSQRSQLRKQQDDEAQQIGQTTVQGAVVK